MTDHNNNKGGYGRISVEQAIWYSSNIGVAKVILKGYEKDPGKYVDGLYRLGLSEDLRLGIPGAGRAKIRRPDDTLRYWSKTTLPWMSFGYETQIPPIYTLAFYNAIANNGKMIRPIFVKEILRNGKTVQSFSTEVIRESICSQRTLNIVRDMLLGVVEKGTGKAVHSEYVRIAGKTGTAQIASGGVYKKAGHQVAFCGYFPADDPKYSCIVVIRQPRNGYPSGGTMSGGVVKAIAEKVYASHIAFAVRGLKRDSTAVMLPMAKAGDRDALEYVLDRLDIDVDTDSTDTRWIVAKRVDEEEVVKLKDIVIREGLVPNVVGMGAKDAVYLLESVGLRVALNGLGRVSSQSISPGARVSKGQTVSLTLK